MLAVSGGVDSMVLLHAATEVAGEAGRPSLLAATFDHATGAHASRAAELVREWGAARGIAVRSQRAPRSVRGEAAWRELRWQFLRAVAREHGGAVVTAHTRDDQLETIVMRILRGSGARGLCALRAPSSIRRPLLDVGRDEVLAYARHHAIPWEEDPTNTDRAFLRNRVRHDLLPALLAARPQLSKELFDLADRSRVLRETCAEAVRPLVLEASPGRVLARGLTSAAWTPDARALLWLTLAEQGGVALDWRGAERLARFSSEGAPGGRIPLAGGYEAVHRGVAIELRRRAVSAASPARLAVDGETEFGVWRFRSVPETTLNEETTRDPWRAVLPADASLQVRAWRDGDRLIATGSTARRVKRYFADHRIPAVDREGWPVVVVDGEIVWIPGVRRGHAASARPGRPRVCIVCERLSS